MRGARLLIVLSVVLLMAIVVFGVTPSDSKDAATAKVQPPMARVHVVEETLHGRKIADPYRWLENGDNPETQRFTSEQLAYTRARLDAQPVRKKIHARLSELFKIGDVIAPHVAGDHYFYTRREAGQNQPVLYVRSDAGGKDRELVNVNTMSADGTVALDWFQESPDGKYVAFGTSPGGSEISTLQVIETETGKLLPEKIDRTRAASIAWLPDNSGFYYTKYPRPGDVPAGQEMYNRHIYFHEMGSNPDGRRDELVFGEGRNPQEWPAVDVSEDGRWLLVASAVTFDRIDLFLKDRKTDGPLKEVVAKTDFNYLPEFYKGEMFIRTNDGAPRFRVMRVRAGGPQRENWKEIIPESDAVLQNIKVVGGKILAEYEHVGTSRLKVFDLDGRQPKDIALPSIGSITGLGGSKSNSVAFYGFHSYSTPPSIYSYDLNTGKTNEWARVEAPVNANAYETKQVFFNSKDGTRVPMFLVHKKGLKLDGANPTLLAGYGGFNQSRSPNFTSWLQVWLEAGGVYADAGLRGGSEYGEEWHKAGMLEKKQNVFDDFIAAAEYLIAQKYTNKDKLAIYGRSNGGLLVGAAMVQRPELFRAVICGVPLVDMLRYHQFQIARLWIPEYGSAENPKQFEFLYAYSPYHHVKKTQYPATLIFTSDGDTRVDPLHARKMTAKLQAVATNGPDRPILMRIEPKAGHGAGKPISKQVDEWTDIFTFLFWQLNVKQ